MGKKIIIKGADFSANKIDTVTIDWTRLTLTEGNWSGNINNGSLVNKNPNWWTSNAVDVSQYSYIKCTNNSVANDCIYIFYRGLPTTANATSLFVSGGRVALNTTLEIPSDAVYAVFMDGNGQTTYSGAGPTVFAGVEV